MFVIVGNNKKSLKAIPFLSIAEFKWKPDQRKVARSEVWKYFSRIGDDTVECDLCSKKYKGGNRGNSNMRIHLQRVHGHKLKNANKERSFQENKD